MRCSRSHAIWANGPEAVVRTYALVVLFLEWQVELRRALVELLALRLCRKEQKKLAF